MIDLNISNELLIGLLVFVVAGVIASQVMEKFLRDRKTSIIIGVIIGLLSAYFLSYSQIVFLINTYSLAGIILLILIPFLISFFFIYSINVLGIIRKMFWIFYCVISIVLLQNNSSFYSEGITLLIIVLTLVILLLDNTIKNWLNTRKNLKRK